MVDLLLMAVDRVEADGHPGGEETPAGTDGHLDGGTEDDPDVGSPSACPDQEVGQVRPAELVHLDQDATPIRAEDASNRLEDPGVLPEISPPAALAGPTRRRRGGERRAGPTLRGARAGQSRPPSAPPTLAVKEPP